MMRVIKYILFISIISAVLAGCSRPKVIPDDQLREIFKEIYLTNAYMQEGRSFNAETDSLDIYRPILSRYGFKVNDLRYTMEDFSKRKSSRITDIIDQTITELEKEESHYRYLVSSADSIDIRAQRLFRDTVYRDSSIKVDKVADTSLLRVLVPVKEGDYEVKYSYLIDSLDGNPSFRTTITMLNAEGRTTNTVTNWMTARRRQNYLAKLTPKPGDSTMQILFGNYPTVNLKTPHMRIDSLMVYYYMPAAQARDSLLWSLLPLKEPRYDNDKFRFPQDSGTQDIHPPRISSAGSSDD